MFQNLILKVFVKNSSLNNSIFSERDQGTEANEDLNEINEKSKYKEVYEEKVYEENYSEISKNKKVDLSKEQRRLIIRDVLFYTYNNNLLEKNQMKDWVKYIFNPEERIFKDAKLLKCNVGKDCYNITSMEFRSLAQNNSELNDVILDAIIGHHCVDSQIEYVETTVTKTIISEHTRFDVPRFKSDRDRYLTVFNHCGCHWVLVMLDKPTCSLYVLDPLGGGSEGLGSELLGWYTEVHHGKGRKPGDSNPRGFPWLPTGRASSGSGEWNFTDRVWKVKQVNRTLQPDRISCGLYCIEYALAMIAGYPQIPKKIQVERDLRKLRKKNVATLLSIAEEIKQ